MATTELAEILSEINSHLAVLKPYTPAHAYLTDKKLNAEKALKRITEEARIHKDTLKMYILCQQMKELQNYRQNNPNDIVVNEKYRTVQDELQYMRDTNKLNNADLTHLRHL
jgi:hypothetical protein